MADPPVTPDRPTSERAPRVDRASAGRPASGPAWASPLDSVPRPEPGRRPPARPRPATLAGAPTPHRAVLPVLWGVLLLVGGAIVWGSLAHRPDGGLPEVWKQTARPERAAPQLHADRRPGGGDQGDLLRLEWPAHPEATGYRVRFTGPEGAGPAPVTVPGTVFLYDLRSNVLHLPDRFDWQVSAVLADGTEIASPARRYPE